MKFLLTTFGSHGDLFPFLAVGHALMARGHACRLATHEVFSAEIRASGIAAEPVIAGIPMATLLHHPQLYHRVRGPLLGARHFARMNREFARDLGRLVERARPDAIVGHFGSLSARWLARDRGIPFASLTLTPMAWNAPDDPVPAWASTRDPAGRGLSQLGARVVDPVVRVLSTLWLRRMRRSCGFPGSAGGAARAGSIWDEFRDGDRVLGMWPAAFRPPLPSDPPGARLCGFPRLLRDDASTDPRLEAFLASGDPPIVFTLGSAAVNHPRRFFEWAAAACVRLGVRGVLLTGRGNPPPGSLPDNVLVVEWAPHVALFPRSRVNVHHGGIGTTAEALAAGRPSVAIPHAFDQFNNALRVARLGAGLVVNRHHLGLERLVRTVDRAIHDASLAERASALAGAMTMDGAERAAAGIEALATEARLRPAAA